MDPAPVSLPQESRSLVDVDDSFGVQPHESCSNGVRSNRVVSDHHDAGTNPIPIDGSIAFHPDDAVDDRVGGPNGAGDVEDRSVDAGPMQSILRPAVDASRQ